MRDKCIIKEVMESIKAKTSSLFNTVYDIGVIIKGLDGLGEFIVGLTLLFSPKLIHRVLLGIVGKTSHGHGHVLQFITHYIAGLDVQLTKSGLAFLIIFLIAHGLVKMVLVVCLLKKITKIYPIALVVLLIFFIYQVYVLVVSPSIGMAIFCALDVIILWLVWREYQMLLLQKVV